MRKRALCGNLELEQPSDFYFIAGHGIQACFKRPAGSETIDIGNDKLFLDAKMDFSQAIRMFGVALQKQGKTVMLVVRRSTMGDTLGDDRDREVVGYIAVADAVRPEARQAIADSRAAGIEKIVMLTGDNHAVAHAIAAEVGITDVTATCCPSRRSKLCANSRWATNR